MFGFKSQPGLAHLLASDLLNRSTSLPGTTLHMSYLQLYRGHMTDLLSRHDRGNLKDLESLTQHPVTSSNEFVRLVNQGTKHRKTASTKLNSSSSRSHAVLTFYVKTPTAPTLKLHVVDLAGSERVKHSGVTGTDLKDATAINLSLFYLVQTVQALVRKDHIVPYNASRLTTILQDALGGPCHTVLIATASPAFVHAKETISTLKFARSCSKVQKQRPPALSSLRGKQPWNVSRANVKKHTNTQPPLPLPWDNAQNVSGGRKILPCGTFGRLSCLAYGNPTAPLALCLHGHPSSAENAYGDWLLCALVYAGYYAVALDMPGRGESAGAAFKSTRSEFNLVRGGPADVVAAAVKALCKKSAVLVGYDWGAGIALAMASAKKYRKSITHVVAFHPSFSETSLGQLKQISANVLLLWCKQDQFHSFGKWKKNAKALSTSLGPRRYTQHVFNEKLWGKYGWSKHVPDLERKIVTFLTGVDPVPSIKEVYSRPQKTETDTEGKELIRCENIVFVEDAQEGKYESKYNEACFEAPDPAKEAVAAFKRLVDHKKVVQAYAGYVGSEGKAKQKAAGLFRKLPVLTPEVLADPMALVEFGLWEHMPKGWHAANQSPRYFAGRRNILVRAPVNNVSTSAGFMTVDASVSQTTQQLFTTTCTRIVGIDQKRCTVAVRATNQHGQEDKPRLFQVPWADIERLNQPHVFPESQSNAATFVFEDGLSIDYSSPLVRAKMCEIALKLNPLIKALDFDASPELVEPMQRKAIRVVRACLDIDTFQQANGDRGRDRNKYYGNRIEKLAVGGQGHCHTVSSVMASYLWPFSKALLIDVKYRGGFTFSREEDVHMQDKPEHHQWLELTCRPSMASFTCDLYREDGPGESGGKSHLEKEMTDSYRNSLYPHGELMRFSDVSVVRAEKLLSSDWEMEGNGGNKWREMEENVEGNRGVHVR